MLESRIQHLSEKIQSVWEAPPAPEVPQFEVPEFEMKFEMPQFDMSQFAIPQFDFGMPQQNMWGPPPMAQFGMPEMRFERFNLF
jgi:hypothetical protein